MMKTILSRTRKKLRYFFQPKAIVLSYHRIADLAIDPWELAVSAENFEQHLQVLKKYKLYTASQLVEQLKQRSLKNGMVCITFDDGYRDNYMIAKPLLQKYQCTSTFFIAVGYLGRHRQFWWDELQYILLGPHNLPQTLSILVNDEPFNFDLLSEGKHDEMQTEKLRSWIWYDPPPTRRSELFIELWKRLKPLSHGNIATILDKLKTWSLSELKFTELDVPLSVDELGELINDPLFEIGNHTSTHPALAFHNRNAQYDEIAACNEILERIGNKNRGTVAYPYGIYNKNTVDVSNQLGLTGGFTTENKAVLIGDPCFELGRFHVKNWSGEEFERRLKYWIKGFYF
jgi:peptidoglycan/xylan/chitin deacetylase (PgdA/CDA1 family)